MTGQQLSPTWSARIDDVAPTVLVIGGFMSSPPMYRELRDLLLERGAPAVLVAPIWTPDWMIAAARGQGPIATRVGRTLLDASAASAASPASGGAPVLVIGHSAGGVIARILTAPEPFAGRAMNGSARIGAIVTLGSPQMFDARRRGSERMGETALWANEHIPGAFWAPRTGYLCVASDAIIGSAAGDRKARRVDGFYRGVISAPDGEAISGDGVVPVQAALLSGVESIVLHDAEHANVIAKHWYGDADHVDAWWPRAVEIWRDALRSRVAPTDAPIVPEASVPASRSGQTPTG